MLSRVADALYWMSRYLERAEHTARLLDVFQHTLLDVTLPDDETHWEPLLASTGDLPPFREAFPEGKGREAVHYMAFDPRNHGSILACVASARENARQVREQISSEMWESLNGLYFQLRAADLRRISEDEPHRYYHAVKSGSHLFQGITDATLTHSEGWHFIQVGRYLERAPQTARLLDVQYERLCAAAAGPQEYLEWVALLKSCSGWEAYCKVHSAQITPQRVAGFLVLHPAFPRSIRFCAGSLQSSLRAITAENGAHAAGVDRVIGRLVAALQYAQPEELIAGGLRPYLQSVQQQCFALHDELHKAYIRYSVEEMVL
ncbi:MAG: alpha-E domain-containing protein [Chloroflexales bacterium]|nr:alpha-E domain-containing protein [Chloroflexales bacterium]